MAKKSVKDELLDHDYDGIQELDNDLPPWWLYMFYFTIIWGVIYLIHFHVLGTGDSQAEEYEKEMQAAAALYSGESVAGVEGAEKPVEELSAFTDDDNLSAGRQVFTTHCQVCHGQNGEGTTVGPNLTDEYWIHGGTMNDVVHTINVGVPAKGMIPWQPVLQPQEIRQVASYILSLQGTNPPNAKAPEGEKVE